MVNCLRCNKEVKNSYHLHCNSCFHQDKEAAKSRYRQEQERRNMINDFCLWCHQKARIVLAKRICYTCDNKGAEIIQIEQEAKKNEREQEKQNLSQELTNLKTKYTQLLKKRKTQLTQEISLIKEALQ